MTTKVGFIGLGNLGRHLASSLLREGFPVAVFDLNRRAADSLLEAGATWGSNAREAATGADVVITCLPNPEAVMRTVEGEGGILEGLRAGGTWIDTSTNDLHELQRLAALAAEQGVSCLEAPVTGGVHRAAAGMITVLVGGEREVFDRHLPVFEAIGGKVFYIGPLGKASVIKVITNMLAFIHIVAEGEALMLAKRGGIDLRLAFDVIKASSGNSFVHETEGQLILNGSYDIGFTMDLTLKDIGFATGFGREFGVPLKLASMTEQIFIEGKQAHGGDAQSTSIVKLLEDELKTYLRAPGFPAKLI